VREALHRLTAEELVEFRANRGFFVASFRLDAVLERLELRLLLEPGIARLAAERRSENDVRRLAETIRAQRTTANARVAHDLSRRFHIELAEATRNDQCVRLLESLWSLDIGRQLLARRSVEPAWQEADAAEHEAILEAIAAADAERAAALAEEHIAATIRHWARRIDGNH
jgi:DNA-binding GntR family transcriptional regulator